MRRLTKTHKAIIFFGLFLTAVYFCVPSVNYTNCLYGEDFRQSEFEGVIVRKYLDKSSHSTPVAELRNYKDSIERISLFGDHSGLFERVNNGDSLKKSRGTMEILKKVNNQFTRFGYADFNCDSVELENERYLFWLYDLTGIVDKESKKDKR
jgi:hypothetical protein